ncbi:unnamed protein product [Rotaria sordida]|uniref:Uncharacterized protein n=1 Tax=Rotaria sordida TaxID=392033 RepID=A0A815RNH8_9BILA|nr:unnamed protein product [Rotaria sordida]CAF4125923.1 unnamed protein product [Rotaria sordida]
MRALDFGDGTASCEVIDHIKLNVRDKTIVFNLYGSGEVNIISTYYQINVMSHNVSVPIDRLLANYQYIIVDNFLQSVIISQQGELFVDGVDIFVGYLERDDLTAKSLMELDDEVFYRTDDLVQIDNDGLLHYRERKDH